MAFVPATYLVHAVQCELLHQHNSVTRRDVIATKAVGPQPSFQRSQTDNNAMRTGQKPKYCGVGKTLVVVVRA